MAKVKPEITADQPPAQLERGVRLTGDSLLEYVEQNRDLPEARLIEGAGFWCHKIRKNGPDEGQVYTQINSGPFYKALAAAKNLVAVPEVSKTGSSSALRRKFRIRTNGKSGNAVITGGYLQEAGINPGDYIRIEVLHEAGEIVLIRDEDQSPATEVPGQLSLPGVTSDQPGEGEDSSAEQPVEEDEIWDGTEAA